jgi:hypothetical protein
VIHDPDCPDRIQTNWATCWTCGVIEKIVAREREILRDEDRQNIHLLKQQGVKEATDRLWRYLTTKCGPITGKGMTNGPVCVDEAVAITGGETL